MTRRREIQTRQGRDGLWFAGGWTNWFDSQEAALDSATDIATQLSGGATAVTRDDPGASSIATVNAAGLNTGLSAWRLCAPADSAKEDSPSLRMRRLLDSDGDSDTRS